MNRFLEMSERGPKRSWAELFNDLGRVLTREMYPGDGSKIVSVPFRFLPWYCQLALRFVRSSKSIQLRAMVEDWPLHRIEEVVRTQGLEMRCVGVAGAGCTIK